MQKTLPGAVNSITQILASGNGKKNCKILGIESGRDLCYDEVSDNKPKEAIEMIFKTMGDPSSPAILFFHAMGVTGDSSTPVAQELQNAYYCILPTSTVYCAGQKYLGKADELRQVTEFLHSRGIRRLKLVVASSLGADLATAFLAQTRLPDGQKVFRYALGDIP